MSLKIKNFKITYFKKTKLKPPLQPLTDFLKNGPQYWFYISSEALTWQRLWSFILTCVDPIAWSNIGQVIYLVEVVSRIPV